LCIASDLHVQDEPEVAATCALLLLAGMTYALPADVQARLQAQSALSNPMPRQYPQQHKHQGNSSRMAALLLDIEARDPRTASQVVLQLLAFRPAAQPGVALQLPSNLSRVYFTLQFYRCGPVLTDPCMLAAAPGAALQPGGMPALHAQQQDGWGTFVLLPQQSQGGSTPAGAGLVLKFSMDGSRPSEVLPGQNPVRAAAQAHLAFCKYLVSHKLSVDVWDADSLLQVGLHYWGSYCGCKLLWWHCRFEVLHMHLCPEFTGSSFAGEASQRRSNSTLCLEDQQHLVQPLTASISVFLHRCCCRLAAAPPTCQGC
jgi:hypothetical protein